MKNNSGTEKLVNGYVYHAISRSIAKYQIYNTDDDYHRMVNLFRFYQVNGPPTSYSMFTRQAGFLAMGFEAYYNKTSQDHEKLVEIIAYCIMPNHVHLVLKQLKDKGIPIFMGNVLNSYTRYFNTLHKRKGPLWESRYKHILVEDDDQLLHLTRYLHLNPTSAKLVDRPENWQYSSYNEYIKSSKNQLINFKDILDINKKSYKKFVDDRKDYQIKLSEIKSLIDSNRE